MAPRTWPALTLVLTTLAIAAPARTLLADAVGPPPASCPPGSTPTSSHAGPLCSPETECSGASCGAGASCTPLRQCVEQRECGGLRPPDSGPCFVSNVVGPCSSDGTCAVGTCTTRNVCSSGGGSSAGCGCTIAGGRTTPTGALLLATLALLGLAVRRR